MEREINVMANVRRMPVKLFELRDRGTTMPVMAVKLFSAGPTEGSPSNARRTYDREAERWLLQRAGYAEALISQQAPDLDPYVILVKLDGVQAQYDPYDWPGSARTLPAAHKYIIEHWNDLCSGDVIDVQFILGETAEPKVSERLTHGQ